LRQCSPLLFVVGLSLILRLAALGVADRPAQLFSLPDSVEYDRLGWNLAAHRVYSLEDSAAGAPDLTRTPVYPLFVAGCYFLAGHSPTAAVLVQIGCAAATTALLWLMGRRFLPAPAAAASAVFLALDPLLVQYATLLLSETVFSLVFVGSLYCLLTYLQKPGWRWASAAALLTGLAILCRPIAVLWPGALLPGFILLAWQQHGWRPLGHYVLILGGSAAVVAPWVVRNQLVAGLPVLTTVPGINLYYHRAAVLVAQQQGISVDEARVLLEKRLRQASERDQLSPSQEYRLMERRGQEIIAAAPGQYVHAHQRAMLKMFLPSPDDPVPGLSLSATYWLEVVFLALVYPLALVGLIAGLRRPGRWSILLLGAVPVYFALLSGPEAYERFRIPVMPAVCLLAGNGVAALPFVAARFQRPGLATIR
jgi:4-amino-4-deoxy-L-arabinose transferase-like glycosyltransferase